MKPSLSRSSPTEQTVWILIVVLLGLVLAFGYLFQQRVSQDPPERDIPSTTLF